MRLRGFSSTRTEPSTISHAPQPMHSAGEYRASPGRSQWQSAQPLAPGLFVSVWRMKIASPFLASAASSGHGHFGGSIFIQ